MPGLTESGPTNVPNFYELFGLPSWSTSKEVVSDAVLKQAYKRTLLVHHPDKKLASRSASQAVANVTVDYITLAYQTLSDPVRRIAYDERLSAEKAARERDSVRAAGHHTGIEIVDLEDLDCNDETGVWSRSCRCGSTPAYLVTEAQLEDHAADGEVTVGCKGCSLWLKVLYTVED